MELKVFWTDTAIEQLENIFDYHKYKAGLSTAKKLVTRIIDRTIQLENHPLSGQKEELLKGRRYEYRYLVESNYKIIYRIENNLVKIAAVFDTRQNPVEMKNLDK